MLYESLSCRSCLNICQDLLHRLSFKSDDRLFHCRSLCRFENDGLDLGLRLKLLLYLFLDFGLDFRLELHFDLDVLRLLLFRCHRRLHLLLARLNRACKRILQVFSVTNWRLFSFFFLLFLGNHCLMNELGLDEAFTFLHFVESAWAHFNSLLVLLIV